MRKAVALVTIGAAAVFLWTLAQALWIAPRDETAPAMDVRESALAIAPHEKPDRLVVPSLGIDADIQYVGVNGKGAMGVPSNYSDVAWYHGGTVPGRFGSAVIAGHVDNGLGLPGVFKDLGSLAPGDEVFIQTLQGSRIRFVVDEVAAYPYDTAPLPRIFGRTDGAWLSLVTCAGEWIRERKTYDERLVVYAKLAR